MPMSAAWKKGDQTFDATSLHLGADEEDGLINMGLCPKNSGQHAGDSHGIA